MKEIALDGKLIFFDKSGRPIPKYCTYCGSMRLTLGKLSSYNDIKCFNCGMYIHDCCSQNDIKQLKELKGAKKE